MKIEKISKDEGYVEITEEEYLEDLASGLSEDEVLKPGRHKFIRGGFLKRHPNFNPATVETVVHISLGLDLEVLKYFKQLAVETNADSYETPIKQALREAMEKARPTRQAVTEHQALIEDLNLLKPLLNVFGNFQKNLPQNQFPNLHPQTNRAAALVRKRHDQPRTFRRQTRQIIQRKRSRRLAGGHFSHWRRRGLCADCTWNLGIAGWVVDRVWTNRGVQIQRRIAAKLVDCR